MSNTAIQKQHYVLFAIAALVLVQAVGAVGQAYAYYWGSDEYLADADTRAEWLYAFSLFFLIAYYMRLSGFKINGSLNYGLIFWCFYPVIVPYILIKRHKILKGALFVFAWLIAMNIDYIVWLVSWQIYLMIGSA